MLSPSVISVASLLLSLSSSAITSVHANPVPAPQRMPALPTAPPVSSSAPPSKCAPVPPPVAGTSEFYGLIYDGCITEFMARIKDTGVDPSATIGTCINAGKVDCLKQVLPALPVQSQCFYQSFVSQTLRENKTELSAVVQAFMTSNSLGFDASPIESNEFYDLIYSNSLDKFMCRITEPGVSQEATVSTCINAANAECLKQVLPALPVKEQIFYQRYLTLTLQQNLPEMTEILKAFMLHNKYQYDLSAAGTSDFYSLIYQGRLSEFLARINEPNVDPIASLWTCFHAGDKMALEQVLNALPVQSANVYQDLLAAIVSAGKTELALALQKFMTDRGIVIIRPAQ